MRRSSPSVWVETTHGQAFLSPLPVWTRVLRKTFLFRCAILKATSYTRRKKRKTKFSVWASIRKLMKVCFIMYLLSRKHQKSRWCTSNLRKEKTLLGANLFVLLPLNEVYQCFENDYVAYHKSGNPSPPLLFDTLEQFSFLFGKPNIIYSLSFLKQYRSHGVNVVDAVNIIATVMQLWVRVQPIRNDVDRYNIIGGRDLHGIFAILSMFTVFSSQVPI